MFRRICISQEANAFFHKNQNCVYFNSRSQIPGLLEPFSSIQRIRPPLGTAYYPTNTTCFLLVWIEAMTISFHQHMVLGRHCYTEIMELFTPLKRPQSHRTLWNLFRRKVVQKEPLSLASWIRTPELSWVISTAKGPHLTITDYVMWLVIQTN